MANFYNICSLVAFFSNDFFFMQPAHLGKKFRKHKPFRVLLLVINTLSEREFGTNPVIVLL